MEKLRYIVNIVIVALLLGAVAIARDGRLFGESVAMEQPTEAQEEVSPIEVTEDGALRIDSSPLAKDVAGFAGRTPVTIIARDGIIESVTPQPNSETPSYFERLTRLGLFDQWKGMTLDEAATANVDAVSGATYSSVAVIENVKRACAYAAKTDASANNPFAGLGIKEIIGLLVILSGAALVVVRPKNKIFEVVQLSLNVVVLGLWCRSFLSLSQFTAWASNGINLSIATLAIVLLVVTLILPLVGKKGSYCYMHCPLGSAQELLGRVKITKLKISPSVNKVLNRLRYYILAALLFVMWIGLGFDIMEYELFAAFNIETASNGILIAAVLFLLLSAFTPRPYCRFVCPTGALLTTMQRTKFE